MIPQHYLALPGTSTPLFPFVEMTGTLTPFVRSHERLTRPGVNGIALWYTGTRGQPFQIQTMCDFPTKTQAELSFKAYRTKVGDQLELYRSLSRWGAVVVHNVTFLTIRKTGVIVGGVNTPSGSATSHLLYAGWVLETLYEPE